MTHNPTMKVHIIDDEREVRESCEFLVRQLEYEAVSLWENGAVFIEEANLKEPAIAIVDLRMPKMSGQEVVSYLKAHKSAVVPIILTGHGDVAQAVAMLKEGAADFLEKPVSMAKLVNALSIAEKLATERFEQYELDARFATLSEREKAVSALVFAGLTNRKIADTLHVAVRTVEVQRANAMKKMDVENIADFIAKLAYVEALKASDFLEALDLEID
ncbi:response regulator [Ignatzschineria sp. RMDPL8A]|uniref:response regulator n=1 Tax=Ignatzschineria sp. RMDPL8A TaxID=2999236 RepID=UPI002446736F|nr:response regulator [Ignatzschineria sp. RMDPL8A]MDG9730576.1 response regulator [Ignatzschineria sp. RMDPL8A]